MGRKESLMDSHVINDKCDKCGKPMPPTALPRGGSGTTHVCKTCFWKYVNTPPRTTI